MNTDLRSPDQLEQEAEQARARLGRTIEALSNKFSPGEFLTQTLRAGKDNGGEFASSLGAQAKGNPLAVMLTGIGITWLMMGGDSNTAGTTDHNFDTETDTDSGKAGSSESKVTDLKNSVFESAREGKAVAGEKLASVSDSVQTGVAQVRTQLDTLLREQPLVAGALGLALGASLGALIPSTTKEDELLGGTRDAVAEKAEAYAEEHYDDVRDTAAKMSKNVRTAVKQETPTEKIPALET